MSKKRSFAPPRRRSIKNQTLSEIKLDSENTFKKSNKKLQPLSRRNHDKDDLSAPFEGNTELKISKYEVIDNEDKLSYQKSQINGVKKLETRLNLKETKIKKTKEKEDDLNEECDIDFFKEYLETDADDMEFDDAVVKDKRKYCEHMKENLIEDQIILSTFVAQDNLKPRSIKIIIFILNVVLYFVVNGLFFSEEVIIELYNIDEEEENFFSFIPRSIERIIYSTLVSIVVGIITNFFFIEEKKN